MAEYITLAEFKTNNPDVDVSRYTDATLTGFITKASSRVDDYTENSFAQTTETDELINGNVNADGSLVIFPRKIPVISLSALAVVKGTTEVTVTLTSGSDNIYNIPTSADRIEIPYSEITYNTVSLLDFGSLRNTNFFVKITYVAGLATVPQSVQDATQLYVLDTLARRSNASGASKIRQGGISIEYAQSSGKSDFVKDAERLLSKYRRVSGF